VPRVHRVHTLSASGWDALELVAHDVK
jgi:hypothetical protein